ncbi:MAG: hypothetical protein AAFW84_24885 [Cyanobacteria bacterium J06635_15]
MQRPLLKDPAVKFHSVSRVLMLAILSGTAIALAAIILDYAGAIDIRFGGDWFQIKIESSEKRLPKTDDAFDDTL